MPEATIGSGSLENDVAIDSAEVPRRAATAARLSSVSATVASSATASSYESRSIMSAARVMPPIRDGPVENEYETAPASLPSTYTGEPDMPAQMPPASATKWLPDRSAISMIARS